MLPRGIRNNNPLNIRIGNKWVGEVENPTDKDFEQFTCMHYGLRAGFKLLQRYINRYHLDCITEIVSRWAPSSENNTASYVSFVVEHSGVGALDTIKFADKQKMCAIVAAMIRYECGQSVAENVISEGYDLALYS